MPGSAPAVSPSLERLEDRRLLAFDPSPQAQEMLEHVNRMRMTPQAEQQVLFTSLDPLRARDADANAAVQYFKDPSAAEIRAEWPTLQPAAPLAWNESLSAAATEHSRLMIQHDTQSHQLPGEPDLLTRTRNAGYAGASGVGENAFAFAKNVFHAHSAFAIDWAVPDRGHRTMMMDPSFKEFGVGLESDTSAATSVGPLVVTQNFGSRFADGGPFVVGVVYRDANANRRYDAGEGLGGATVRVVGPSATFTTTTMSAGGYQLQVPQGTYTITATGGGLPGLYRSTNVQVVSANVKVDFDATSTPFAVRPTSPTGVVVTVVNRRATVQWTPPASNGGLPISRYVIQYSTDGGTTWQTARVARGTVTSAPVLGLQYGATYVFRVAAGTLAGNSIFSRPSTPVIPTAPLTQTTPTS